MIAKLPTYDEARRAAREGKDPTVFLYLGIIYSKGVGVTSNQALANYFYEKALSMGCSEAQDYIEQERANMNYGYLSMLRNRLPLFYPNYSQEKAIDDILRDRNTIDADIYYAINAYHNRSEIDVDQSDRLLAQLFSPITSNKKLFQRIIERNSLYALTSDESDFLQSVFNFSSSYENVCARYTMKESEFCTCELKELFPYIKPSQVSLIKRQAFNCLISVKNTEPKLMRDFLNNLDKDEEMLNICEDVKDQDLQLLLISYVEIGIDADALLFYYRSLRQACKEKDTATLCRCLNECAQRLISVGIRHHLPVFTPDNVPEIGL